MRPFDGAESLYTPFFRSTSLSLYPFPGPPPEGTGETKGQFWVYDRHFTSRRGRCDTSVEGKRSCDSPDRRLYNAAADTNGPEHPPGQETRKRIERSPSWRTEDVKAPMAVVSTNRRRPRETAILHPRDRTSSSPPASTPSATSLIHDATSPTKIRPGNHRPH